MTFYENIAYVLVISFIFLISYYFYCRRDLYKEPTHLSDFVPWDAMIGKGVIVNKDGSFQVSISYRGPDMDSATEEEMEGLTVRINNILKRVPGNWAIFAESQRKENTNYLTTEHFPDFVTKKIEDERKEHFTHGTHFESEYFFTLVYLPPEDNTDKVKQFFVENNGEKIAAFDKHYNHFLEEARKIVDMLEDVLSEVHILDADETLTYLHSTISPKWHSIQLPTAIEPIYLAEMLSDSNLLGGTAPKIGNHFLKIVSIRSYPNDSWPGIFDQLNRLNFRYRWVTRFITLEKTEAVAETEKYRNQWYQKRTSTSDKVKKAFHMPVNVEEEDKTAVDKSKDAEAAIYEINNDIAMYGYYTTAIIVLDEDENQANDNAKMVEKIINNIGFTAKIEDWNAVHAWLGCIPGLCRANIRRPLLSTINLAHMLPISAIWAGPKDNSYLKGPVLLYTETHGSSHFRLSLHGSAQKGVADLGHALIVGPPGSGKSVLLGILAAQTMKYPDAEIYYFDKGGSSRVLTMGVGGQFYDLGAEEDLLSFQPLRDIHKPEVRNWASEWVKGLLIMQGLQITPSRSDFIWEALNSLADFEEKQRSMTGLYNFLLSKDEAICDALKPYTRLGPHGKMLDSEDDRFYAGRWQTFEMEHIWNMKSVLPAILTYLFYQVQRRVDGKKPVTIFLDECWTMFKDDTFSEEINKWLKELRKFKANVVFATQSLTDIANCAIAPTVMDTCQSKIFLPNPNALEENMYKTYISFGLNRQEIEIIANATPKRHYYFKSPSGCRLFQLALGPAAMAYCAATSKEEQKTAKNIFDEYGGDLFNQKWLEHKNSPILAKKIEKVGSL